MKQVSLLIVVLLVSSQIAKADHWSTESPKNAGPRYVGGHATAVVGNDIFHFDGYYEYFGDRVDNNTCEATSKNLFYSKKMAYKTTNRKWREISQYGPARAFGAAVADEENEKIYYHGGGVYNATYFNKFEDLSVYDINTDTWSELNTTEGPGGILYHGLIFHNQKLYSFGGIRSFDFTASNDLFKFDIPSNSWNQVLAANPPHPRDGFISAKMNIGCTPVMVVIGGEYLSEFGFVRLGDAHYFNLTSEEWYTFNLNAPLYIDNVKSYGVIDNKLYIFSGEDEGSVGDVCCSPFAQNPTNFTRVFDPETASWDFVDVEAPVKNIKRASGDVVRGKLYVGQGWTWDCDESNSDLSAQEWNNSFFVFSKSH
jgi:N-acetylneuraminic acid mutarotase